MADPYIKITENLLRRTDDAFIVSQERWIPFALVKASDERRIKATNPHSVIEFNLREWKAIQLGLI